jgi:hypothetical protein
MGNHGHCLCKGIQYEITADPLMMGTCHCGRCQRRGGGAGNTAVGYPPGSVNITQGEDLITVYEIEEGSTRRFCSRCGSPVFGVADNFIIVQAGMLTEDPGIRPQFHMMVDYKASWDEIHDDLPQFPEYPPMDG